MNLSNKIKNIFDVISAFSSYLSIIAFGFILIFSFQINEIERSKVPAVVSPILTIIGMMIITFPLILYYKDRIMLKYTIIRGKLSGYVIEKQKVTIDIISKNGDIANINQSIFFHQFSNVKKHPVITKLSFPGNGIVVANSIQSTNCFYKLNNEQNCLEVSYVNQMEKLNNIPNFFKKNDKFIVLYATIRNAFENEKEEFWTLTVKNLCQDYTFELLIPATKKFKYARFYKVEKNKEHNQEFETIQDIQPLIIEEHGQQKISLRIMNFDKLEMYRIRWLIV